MGQRDIRRLLIVRAMAVLQWVSRKGSMAGSWINRMVARMPSKRGAMALANKMARAVWTMLTKHVNYRDPAIARA